MTWTHAIDWQGYHLTLNREAGHIPAYRASSLPPAPGAGAIRFPALFLYANGSALHLEGEITGGKIAHVYLEVYWQADDGWLAGPIHRRELPAPQSKEIGGVAIPLWGESNKLSAAWEPEMFLIVSGEDAAWAFPQPSQSNQSELWLHALIITKDMHQPARLFFSDDGELRRMALLDRDPPGGSRGTVPQAGNQLVPAFDWLRKESGAWQTASGSTNPIPVSEQLPQLKTIPAPPGRYQVGLLAHDLDGQVHRGLISCELHTTALNNG